MSRATVALQIIIRRSTLSLRLIGVRLNSKLFTQTVIWRAVIMRRGQTRAHLSRRRRREARCQASCSTSIWRQHVWFGAGKWGHFARAPVEKYRGLAESHIAECANARFRPPPPHPFFCTLPPGQARLARTSESQISSRQQNERLERSTMPNPSG